jgi:formate C-acetyltransferase
MFSSCEEKLSYNKRIELLRDIKRRHTQEKQTVLGFNDNDDHGRILPPPELREIVEYVNASGVLVRDARLNNFKPIPNHPSGGFFGPKACGKNFRRFLEAHPVYINPLSSLAGGYMAYFTAYFNPSWKPEIDISAIQKEMEEYGVIVVIPGLQHFCQDMSIGFKLGWGGLLEKIRYYRKINPTHAEFYDGLEEVVLGVQHWISRHAKEARRMAEQENDPVLRKNLEEMAEINEHLVTEPPKTFREACQWTAWYQMVARMYNGSGSMGRLDVLLYPFYERDIKAGILTDDEAVFHLACLLLIDTPYIQLGGPDENGKDATNRVSFLILETAHLLKTPANIGVCVWDGGNPRLVKRALEILFEDKAGVPKFLGIENIIKGFTKNGYPIELARQRAYSGCHWFAIPGREYTMNDLVKINFVKLFEKSLKDMMKESTEPNVGELWRYFEINLKHAIEVAAKAIDINCRYLEEVYPELVLDLLCHGPIERGLDASNGGVALYNIGVDGSGLATTADSFAAVEQIVEIERKLSWQELVAQLDSNFQNSEYIRLMLRNVPKFGQGGTRADAWAQKIVKKFVQLVKEKPTPMGHNMIPGLFSWALMISLGKSVGATPNGRHAGDPISQGANPEPGSIRGASAPTALATAVASVQCGYGNTVPLQLDIDPIIARGEEGLEKIEALIRGHFALGGTMINMNVINKKLILEAHKDPSKYPDLIVRVTGFSAYFASLSPELRQLIVDRIIAEDT